MRLKEIGSHAQNMIILLDLIINIIRGGGTRKLYNLLMSTRTVTLINDTIFIRALKIQPLEGRVFVVDGMRGMHTFIQR